MTFLKTIVNFFRRIISYLRSIEIVDTPAIGAYNPNNEFDRTNDTISTYNPCSEDSNSYPQSQETENVNDFNGFGGGDFGGAGAEGSWEDNSVSSNDYSDPSSDNSSYNSNENN